MEKQELQKSAKPSENAKANSKSSKGPSKQILDLVETGIPLQMAVFHRTVRSVLGEPETAFYSSGSNKPSRTANMWYTPHGLVVEQRGHYKIIPLANISDTIVL